MRRAPLASLLLLASALPAAEVRPAPQPRQRITPEIVASFTNQPKPVEVQPLPETTPVLQVDSLTLAARAAGELVRMAPYVITQPRMKLPEPAQVLTPKGKLEVARQKQPGLRFLSFWGLNDKVALAMYEEDLALQRKREMADLWALYLIK
jgi:hypothetical protein